MATTLDELERRVTVLEAQMRVNDADHAVINEKLNTLIGGQDAMRAVLRDHGRLLGSHDARLDTIDAKLVAHDARFDAVDARLEGIDGKLDIVLAWIGTQS